MGFPIKNEALFAKIETTYGTDAVPTAGSNALLFGELQIVPFEDLRMAARAAVRASLDELQQVYGGSLSGLRFTTEIKGSGAAGTAPEIGPLLRGVGLGETIVASTSVTYKPVSTGLESLSMYAFEGGRVRHIVTGCRGNATFRFPAHGIPMAEFEFVGWLGTPSDQAQPNPTISAVVPRAVKGMAATIGGVSGLEIQEFELALNNDLPHPDNINNSEGFAEIVIAGRDPVLSVTKHSVLIATMNPFADLKAGTARAFASGALGSAGNIIQLNCPQMHYREVGLGSANSIRNRRLQFGAHASSTPDDNFSLIFT